LLITFHTIEMAPITDEERNTILKEVEDSLERITINKDSVKIYFRISTKGKNIVWMPILCKKCYRPLYVHTEPECSLRTKIAKQKQTLYIATINNNETVKHEMEWAILEAGI